MAYEKFIPKLWAETINRELERVCVFAEDCNRQYEGTVAKKGDTVHILGINKPTIHTLERSNASGNINGAEEVVGNSIALKVDQIRYFNYKVGDIDKYQAVGGLMDALSAETAEGLANEIDKYIANFAVFAGDDEVDAVPKLNASTAVKVTKDNVLTMLDDAIQMLQENDVNVNAGNVVVTVSPRFYKLFKQAYLDKHTDNTVELKNGKVAMYGNVTVKLSNNVCKTDDGATDNIMIRTKRAIAFVNPLTHTEPYRPENSFADAVKGFELFAGRVVRPKEVININVKYA